MLFGLSKMVALICLRSIIIFTWFATLQNSEIWKLHFYLWKRSYFSVPMVSGNVFKGAKWKYGNRRFDSNWGEYRSYECAILSIHVLCFFNLKSHFFRFAYFSFSYQNKSSRNFLHIWIDIITVPSIEVNLLLYSESSVKQISVTVLVKLHFLSLSTIVKNLIWHVVKSRGAEQRFCLCKSMRYKGKSVAPPLLIWPDVSWSSHPHW